MKELSITIGDTLLIVQMTLTLFALFALIFQFPKTKIRLFLIIFFTVYSSLYSFITLWAKYGSLVETQMLAGSYIFVNLIYSVVMVLLMTEIVVPNWLTFRRALSFPIVPLGICLLGGIYVLITEGGFEVYTSYRVALSHIDTFDFWWRIISLSTYNYFQFFYFWKLFKATRLHNNYLRVNLSNNESYSVKWIVDLLMMIVGLNIAYLICIIYDSYFTRILCYFGSTVFFSYFVMRIFKPKDLNPPIDLPILYDKGGWVLNSNIDETEWVEHISDSTPQRIEINKAYFNALPEGRQRRLTDNLEVLKEWMANEKPYLKADIRRDVLMTLGMNSTDMNDLFKIGLQTTFPLYILHHRINEAKSLLVNNPDMTIKEIAYNSGFTSPSVFSRSFQSYENMTPLQYRKNNIIASQS